MSGWNDKISNVSVEELKEKLRAIDDDGKAVKRVFTAIAYKNGDSPYEIQKKYGISQSSIYGWLDRIEKRGLDDAIYDDSPPGADSKLTDEQWDELFSILDESPKEVGYDFPIWKPKIVRDWLKEQFDVDYTLRHIRRLLKKAGFSWRTARPEHHKTDPEKIAEFKETFKKRASD